MVCLLPVPASKQKVPSWRGRWRHGLDLGGLRLERRLASGNSGGARVRGSGRWLLQCWMRFRFSVCGFQGCGHRGVYRQEVVQLLAVLDVGDVLVVFFLGREGGGC